MAKMAPLPSLGGWVKWYASPSQNPHEISQPNIKLRLEENPTYPAIRQTTWHPIATNLCIDFGSSVFCMLKFLKDRRNK